MNFLSICSGIDAASVAWNPIGWKAVGFSEIEPFPSAVLKHHHPDVVNFGDMTRFHEWPDLPELRTGVIVGGTPCQAFSIAGLRGGLDDARGNLALVLLRIVARYRPRWIIWENVPGVLSSNKGRDFGAFVGGLGEIGYGWAYRILDAQFFGIPQQRRRVFVVGYFGNWRRAVAALFETPRRPGDSAPRRRARSVNAAAIARDAGISGVAGTISRSYEKGHGRTGGTNGGIARGHLIPSTNQSLCLNAGGMGRQDLETETLIGHLPDVAKCLTSGSSSPSAKHKKNGVDQETLIACTTAATITGSPYGDGVADESKLIGVPDPNPMTKAGVTVDELVRAERDRKSKALAKLAPAPIAPIPKPDTKIIAFIPRSRGDDGRGYSRPPSTTEDVSPTLETVKTPMIAGMTIHGSHDRVKTEASPADIAKSITTAPPGESTNCSTTVAVSRAGVRRLTCRECERLQGFPDDFTLIPWKGRRDAADIEETIAYLIAAGWPADEAARLAVTPDGPRYKALGNSMAVPVMRWIGERIAFVDAIP